MTPTDFKWPAPPVIELPDGRSGGKDTNPKDRISSTKLPLELVPDTMAAYAATAFANGASKYGTANWRVAGVRASVYNAAMRRHLARWWNGEDFDEEGIHNLAGVLACAAIILDADLVGKLTDDRPPRANVAALFDRLMPQVQAALTRNAGRNPRHYTIADGDQPSPAPDRP